MRRSRSCAAGGGATLWLQFVWAWVIHGLTIVPDLMLVTRANVALGLPDALFMIGDNFLSTMMGAWTRTLSWHPSPPCLPAYNVAVFASWIGQGS